MNQTRNLIQWKNLTNEEAAGFDFENYKYEFQHGLDWILKTNIDLPINGDSTNQCVYRLVIELDKFYYTDDGIDSPSVDLGSNLIKWDIKGSNEFTFKKSTVVRPAKPSEIPKPERVFKDGAFYPVIHTATGLNRDVAEHKKGFFWVTNSDDSWKESEFSWIGEELKIKWGEG